MVRQERGNVHRRPGFGAPASLDEPESTTPGPWYRSGQFRPTSGRPARRSYLLRRLKRAKVEVIDTVGEFARRTSAPASAALRSGRLISEAVRCSTSI